MMRISLAEPVRPRYIYINFVTNQVHVLVPVVGGQEISTDNTCKSTLALREFFDGGALAELNTYKDKLVFDIGLFEIGDAERIRKEDRLTQIESYIKAISAMQYRYSNAISAVLKRPSNLYSIQLRPREPDYASNVINPVFNIERKNDIEGVPLSPLYCEMHHTYTTTEVANQDPQTDLITAVLKALPSLPEFEQIQRVLHEQCNKLFGLLVDFTKCSDGTPATQTVIDELTGLGDSTTKTEEYIHALLSACALNLWEIIPISPFYNGANCSVEERTEKLSILTQFFLAHLNFYCTIQGISSQNFGIILDDNPQLSHSLVHKMSQALVEGAEVEKVCCDFFNAHRTEFQFSRLLTEIDVDNVKQKFIRNWRTISTGENTYMDDFMILDTQDKGSSSIFVMHQGSICVDLAQIITPDLPNQSYFSQIREDFVGHPVEIPHFNEHIDFFIDVDPEILLSRINDEQFEKLSDEVKAVCYAHPYFQHHHLLHAVAKGREQDARVLLNKIPANIQNLLRSPGIFTDYSGRIFNCTAFEYSYWAKDIHMCRMLINYMDEETKAQIFERIEEIEHFDEIKNQKKGLEYQQHGHTLSSSHFELTSLKNALQEYVTNYDMLEMAGYSDEIENAWLKVGKAQRDIPAHVAQEYCRIDCVFDSNLRFNEDVLPRELTFHNWTTGKDEFWFPLTDSCTGLGFKFALMRGNAEGCATADIKIPSWAADLDLKAIIQLDEVRTSNLQELKEQLNLNTVNNDAYFEELYQIKK